MKEERGKNCEISHWHLSGRKKVSASASSQGRWMKVERAKAKEGKNERNESPNGHKNSGPGKLNDD